MTVSEWTTHGLSHKEALICDEAVAAVHAGESSERHWLRLCRDVLHPRQPLALHRRLHGLIFPDEPLAPAWIPPEDVVASSHLAAMIQSLGLTDYESLHRWSVREPDAFWSRAIEDLGIVFRQAPESTLDLIRGPASPSWLTGAEYNIVESCLQADDNALALLEGSERSPGSTRSWTYGELKTTIGQVANSLLRAGVKPGEVIAIDMPMRAESVWIYLGALAAGIAVVTIADSFAPAEIRVRLSIARPRLIFTQDVIRRGDKVLPLYDRVCEADAPQAVVLAVDSNADGSKAPMETASDNLQVALRTGDVYWPDFLAGEEAIPWHIGPPEAATTILFSSGTTGDPKAIPWDQLTPIKAAMDARLHQDVHEGDRLCWPSNMGWMMGPWLVFAALMNRAAIVLYDGSPTTQGFVEFVEAARVTMLGLVPSLVSAWRSQSLLERVDWTGLRVLSSTGECSNPDDMFYLMAHAGYKPVIEYCGGTEIGGGYITGTVVQPAIPSTFSTPAMGIDVAILDDQGRPAQVGELFLRPPSIGLSTRLLNADHDEVYFANTPSADDGMLRRHGDRMERLQNGYYRAHGRADDTMNLGGIKVSSLQIEEIALAAAPEMREVAAVATPPPDGGPDRLAIFAVPRHPPQSLDAASRQTMQQTLQQAIQLAIRTQLNPLFKVHKVVFVDSLPRTASNKVMRRQLRRQVTEPT